MLKVKSKSKDNREINDPVRVLKGSSPAYENRLLRTAEFRNNSSQFGHLARSMEQSNPIKHREFSTAKYQRKQSRPIEDIHPLRVCGGDQRQSKKHVWSKTFIGSKLRKKLQKYLLFLSLINYSLRICYEKQQIKKYRVFIGKGNNSKLVKSIFTSRHWWVCTDDQHQANLVWTQKSKKKVFSAIIDLQTDKLKFEIQPEQIKRKIKVKRKDNKRIFFDKEIEGVLTDKDKALIKSECRKENLLEDVKSYLKKTKAEKRKRVKVTHNHIQNHRLLTNKKNLYHSLKNFCEESSDNVFNYVPLTFHLTATEQDYSPLQNLEDSLQSRKDREKLLWIIKPGENSNRGCGIEVLRRVDQVKKYVERESQKHPERSFIVQKYISPFLFHRRKFDIRCFALVTATPLISAYFYPIGYLRTSSFQFSLKNCSNKYIHLTNDAVQKKASEYSKYEVGNKVSFEDFQKYLQMFHAEKNINFFNDILPVLRQLVVLSIKSARNFDKSSKQHTFEILGYDFMLDEDMQPWLIEINTNPCLQTSCQLLAQIIPSMVENAVKIAVDPVFRPPKIEEWSFNQLLTCSYRLLQKNRFELVYSQLHEA